MPQLWPRQPPRWRCRALGKTLAQQGSQSKLSSQKLFNTFAGRSHQRAPAPFRNFAADPFASEACLPPAVAGRPRLFFRKIPPPMQQDGPPGAASHGSRGGTFAPSLAPDARIMHAAAGCHNNPQRPSLRSLLGGGVGQFCPCLPVTFSLVVRWPLPGATVVLTTEWGFRLGVKGARCGYMGCRRRCTERAML